MVNLYQLYFSTSHFLSQLNKKVFYPSTFPPLKSNTDEGKLNLFYPLTFPSFHNFLSSHFSIISTKQTLKEEKEKENLSSQSYIRLSDLLMNSIPIIISNEQQKSLIFNFLFLFQTSSMYNVFYEFQ